jgi:hypothetical protein
VKSTELEITINEVISFYLGDSNDKRNTMRELILYDPSSAFDKKVDLDCDCKQTLSRQN